MAVISGHQEGMHESLAFDRINTWYVAAPHYKKGAFKKPKDLYPLPVDDQPEQQEDMSAVRERLAQMDREMKELEEARKMGKARKTNDLTPLLNNGA